MKKMKDPIRIRRFVCAPPPDEEVLGIVVHNGAVIVATSGGVYRLEGDQLKPIPFETPA